MGKELIIRVDENTRKKLERVFPRLTDEGATQLVQVILKKFAEEAEKRCKKP